MRRVIGFVYGVTSYAIFFVTYLYLIGFLANVVVPKGVDGGIPGATGASLLVNLGLIALFGLQHSVMARPAFKERLTALLPESIERSTFVLASSLVLIVLYWQWRPLPQVIWSLESPFARTLMWGVLLTGFGIALLSTFIIDHFELFGLRQVSRALLSRAARQPSFRVTYLYKFMRHPLYFGMLLGLWGTPDMTLGHLIFATGMSVYVLIGIHFEERDLEVFLGDEYRQYKRRVPMLIPSPGKAHETVRGRPQDSRSLVH